MASPNVPVGLKILQREANAQKAKVEIVPPDWLSEAGRAAWARICPDLVAAGIVAAVDATALALLCEDLALLIGSRDDSVQGQFNRGRAVDRVRGFLSDFGMTPASRRKIVVTREQPSGEQKFARFAS